MNFRLFFEARQEFIDKIHSAIEKVDERPFKELFGNNERFLVKVFNPKFEKAFNNFGYTAYAYDQKNRTINDRPYAKWIKAVISNAKERIDKDIREILKDKNIYAAPIMSARSIYHPLWTIYDADGSLFNNLELPDALADKMFEQTDELTIRNNFKYKIKNKEMLIDFIKANWKEIENNSSQITPMEFKHINGARKIKQIIDQNNIYYYLLFSRHPIDVLRMSDHKGISSCHKLDGGSYAHCAIADAKNDGGIVYLVKGSDGQKVRDKLNDKEIFHDDERDTGLIRPIGRIRLRRFVDLQTGDDFAVPTTLQSEQKYGLFTKEIYSNLLEYVQKHQKIYANPPDANYAAENIVLVGGEYSDESIGNLLHNFFGKTDYSDVKHKSKNVVNWDEEISDILQNMPKSKFAKNVNIINRTHYILVWYEVHMKIPKDITLVQLSRYADNPSLYTTQVFENMLSRWRTIYGNNAQEESKYDISEMPEHYIIKMTIQKLLDDPEELRPIFDDFIDIGKYYLEKGCLPV